jgi:hypothetical protein
MDLLKDIATRALLRGLNFSLDDFVFATISIGQKDRGEKGGTISREYFDVFVFPKSIYESRKFGELLHCTGDIGKRHCYFTKETHRALLDPENGFDKYYVASYPYSLLEEIEEKSGNNGKRWERLGCFLFTGQKTDKYKDTVLKIDVETAQKRSRKQFKFCGFSEKGRKNKRSSYSGANLDID